MPSPSFSLRSKRTHGERDSKREPPENFPAGQVGGLSEGHHGRVASRRQDKASVAKDASLRTRNVWPRVWASGHGSCTRPDRRTGRTEFKSLPADNLRRCGRLTGSGSEIHFRRGEGGTSAG